MQFFLTIPFAGAGTKPFTHLFSCHILAQTAWVSMNPQLSFNNVSLANTRNFIFPGVAVDSQGFGLCLTGGRSSWSRAGARAHSFMFKVNLWEPLSKLRRGCQRWLWWPWYLRVLPSNVLAILCKVAIEWYSFTWDTCSYWFDMFCLYMKIIPVFLKWAAESAGNCDQRLEFESSRGVIVCFLSSR